MKASGFPIWRRFATGAAVGVLAVVAVGCEGFKLGGGGAGRDREEVPEDGLLGAKLGALRYAMDHLPEEDRRFGDGDYAAYGIVDPDELHQKALVELLKDRRPPVVDASVLYNRSSNSQWIDGRPALKWSATAAKRPDHPRQAEVLVGWMHSKLINEFTTYVLEFDGDAWSVVDVLVFEPGS